MKNLVQQLTTMFRRCVLAAAALCVVSGVVRDKYGTKYIDFEKIIKDDGYPVETHHVVNGDKYILELNRIPHSQSSNKTGRPVVFLMHGLLGSAASFFDLGPYFSPAYNLADAGFDVWLGNARGVLNSRRHLTLDPDRDAKFFDFTFEDIALDDLPAMIGYVLGHTGQEKLHYVGHSQGGTVFLVLNSMKPEYNQRFESAHLLAAVGYQRHFPNDRLRKVAEQYAGLFEWYFGSLEIFGPNWNEHRCDSNDSSFCKLYNETIIEVYGASKVRAGASLKQIAHFAQNIKDKKFRRWDFGFWRIFDNNLWNYGTTNPPEYDLALVTAPVTLHYSKYDILLAADDVMAMYLKMPNAAFRTVPSADFSHTGFTSSSECRELVTGYIIEEIKNRSKSN